MTAASSANLEKLPIAQPVQGIVVKHQKRTHCVPQGNSDLLHYLFGGGAAFQNGPPKHDNPVGQRRFVSGAFGSMDSGLQAKEGGFFAQVVNVFWAGAFCHRYVLVV